MLKKTLAIITSILVLVSFTACNSDNDSTDDSTSAETTEATSAIESSITDEKAYNTAKDVLEKVKNGEDFDELIKEYGEDPGMQSKPYGYLFTKGTMVKAFETASFALDINEVSDIVETEYGYHIIKRLPIDEEYYDLDKEELVKTYNYIIMNDKYQELAEKLTCTYADGFDKVNPTNFDNFDADVIVTIDGVEYNKDFYGYFYKTYMKSYDQGNSSYWTSNTDKYDEVKQQVEYVLKLYRVLYIFADEHNIKISDETNKKVNDYIEQVKTALGGDDVFKTYLKENNLTEDTLKDVLTINYFNDQLYNDLFSEGKEYYPTKEEVLSYMADTDKSQYIRCKHILISKSTEETTSETTSITEAETTNN